MSGKKRTHVTREPIPGLREAVGDVVREMREGCTPRMTQKDLAWRSEVSRTYVSLIERGLRNITLDVLFAFCETCGVEPADAIQRIIERWKQQQQSAR